jgi:PAS domain S-box-containing protein
MDKSSATLDQELIELKQANEQLKRELAESKQMLETLRHSETIYRTLLENASDCVCHISLDGKFMYMNQGGVELNELTTANEIYGKDSVGSIKPEYKEQMYEALDRARKGERTKIEYASINAKGRELWWDSVVNAIKDNNGKVIGLLRSSRNINDQKQKTQALKEAKQAADIANQAKSEFLANISHELRTPLNGILGYAQILQRDRALTAKQQDALGVIHQCSSHLLNLINDILDLSKIEARKMELCDSTFHFPSFLQGVVEICRIRAEQKDIAFTYQPPSNLPIGIKADEKCLRQVLINLLGNAIKFTQYGGVNFKVEVISHSSLVNCQESLRKEIEQMAKDKEPLQNISYVQGTRSANGDTSQTPVAYGGKASYSAGSQRTIYKIRFLIIDTGIGMSQEKIEKIFLPFEQVCNGKKQTEGTGLGLAISQKIVQLMGSTIQVKSKLGEGSSFWIDIDLPEVTDWVQTVKTSPQGKIIGIEGDKRKILIVDDRWENRSVLINLLKDIGFETAEAANGEEGLEQASVFQPNLIITDLIMPVMDGFEMMRQIKRSPKLKEIAIIVSSASVFETDQYKSLTAGGDDFLPKPVQIDDLLQKLQKHLQLKWIYETKEQVAGAKEEKTLPPSLLPPEPEELETLFNLAKRGNLKGILVRAEKIEQIDEKFMPFAIQLRQLANDCQVKKIREFISLYRGVRE